MTDRVHHHPNRYYSLGTPVVTLVKVLGGSGKVLQPRGPEGVADSPADLVRPCRGRFADGIEESLNRDQQPILARFKRSQSGENAMTELRCNLDVLQQVLSAPVVHTMPNHAKPKELGTNYITRQARSTVKLAERPK